jgi:hypothetical protein
LLINLFKAKQKHGKNENKKRFVYKLYGFCCCAYQNKKKIVVFVCYAWANKCKTITFSRTRYPVEFAYILARTVLDRVSSINNLVVIMDEKMNFSEHVDIMVGKAIAMLGIIIRLSFEFKDPYTLRSLYMSLVRPKLEYASCV